MISKQFKVGDKPIAIWIDGEVTNSDINTVFQFPLIFAQTQSTFHFTYQQINQNNSFNGFNLLYRRLGRKNYWPFLVANKPLSEMQALEIGLIDGLINSEEFDQLILNLKQKSLSAMELALNIVERGINMSRPQGEFFERFSFALRLIHRDPQEGFAAFLEKRTAKFLP